LPFANQIAKKDLGLLDALHPPKYYLTPPVKAFRAKAPRWSGPFLFCNEITPWVISLQEKKRKEKKRKEK
jgi:hypothetical protein